MSLLIVWHFSAIFLAALSIGTTSPLVMNVAQRPPMQWYLDALYLNQGHSFFAPNVGPGHIISYEFFDNGNRMIDRGTLPDKKQHWPRLLYHRHMMLADQANVGEGAAPSGGNMQRMLLDAYARHLLRVNKDAQAVRVQLYAHYPLPSFYLKDGRKRGYELLMQDMAREGQNRRINEEGYELLEPQVTVRRSDLGPEDAEGSTGTSHNLRWQSERQNMAGRWNGGPR